MSLELLYPALILIGLTIIVVYGWLLHRAKRAEQTLLALIQLNEKYHLDLVDFLEHAWDVLQDTRLRGYSWELDWFDNHLQGQCGETAPQQKTHTLTTPEASLSLYLYYRKRRGDRLADGSLWQTFLLLLRMDLWMKVGIVNTTQAHMDKLSLFLAHDVKNIAQYLQLTADQLQSPQGCDDEKLLKRMRQSFPLMRRRAESVLRTLHHSTQPHNPQAQNNNRQTHALLPLLEEICHFHNLPATISGEGSTSAPLRTTESIIDNLLKNYADEMHDQHGHPALEIHIEPQQQTTRLCLRNLTASPTDITGPARIKRLFEPLYTTNPQGNGIGLYQARHQARAIGGDLRAEILPDGSLQFELFLPSNVSTLRISN